MVPHLSSMRSESTGIYSESTRKLSMGNCCALTRKLLRAHRESAVSPGIAPTRIVTRSSGNYGGSTRIRTRSPGNHDVSPWKVAYAYLELLWAHQVLRHAHQETIVGPPEVAYAHRESGRPHQEIIVGPSEVVCAQGIMVGP